MTDRGVQPAPDFLRRDAGESESISARAELFLETYRVSGTIVQPGVNRRLVDVLNTIDGPLVLLKDATLESGDASGQPRLRVDHLHVRRDAILIAVPASAAAPTNACRRSLPT